MIREQSYIDLHMHSRYSDDGEFTPKELVAQCRAAGIRIMSVTDHNCAKANAEAERAAAQAGIKFIPGIEIDCTYQGVDFQLLGYGIDYRDTAFTKIEEHIARQNREASYQRLRLINQLGFHVTAEELGAISAGDYWPQSWTGEKFAQILLSKPEYSDHELLKPYRPGGARSDNPYANFYWDFCAQGKPCYVKIEFSPLAEVIQIIHATGGKAVLAHPGLYFDHIHLLAEMVALGLDGIEVGSGYHTQETSAYFYQQALAHGLLVTGGSDYHGTTKPAIRLGEYVCPLPEKEIEARLEAAGLLA
ncbi:PHP domain-containing protein [Capillibacterium thermochitinicola]|uniref:PHP domain-containing protein n=1 Tax=Capillibacterium thermochitinicola TaxID=2699427 RepID=A0A8J6I0R5_9FIRM|nr:PHP domain-containing protein [Capillibacterium thermochitinicola]MBA2132202.1 PHP domain-containing protein [Capillibacterium thermochitinicola]